MPWHCPASGCGWNGCGRNHCHIPCERWARLSAWARFYHLEKERYRVAFSGKEGEHHALALPGFWLRVEWMWQEPLPHPLRALGEIVGLGPVVGLGPEVEEQFVQALRGRR